MACTTWAAWTASARSSRNRTSRCFTPNGKDACWRWSAPWGRRAPSTSTPRGSTGRRCRPHVYLSSSYYQKWLLGLEDLLIDKGYIAAGSKSLRVTRSNRPSRSSTASSRLMMSSASWCAANLDATAPAPAKFKPGDRVRAKNIHPATHTQAATLCARPCRRGRARPRLPRFSGLGRDRIRRESAMALHRRVRRSRAVGSGRRSDASRYRSMPSSPIWRRRDGHGRGARHQRPPRHPPRRRWTGVSRTLGSAGLCHGADAA